MRKRHGFTFVESLLALTVLAGLISLVTQAVVADTRQRRELERRAIALEITANTLEQITALPYDEITTEAIEQLELAADSLPGGAFEVDIEPVTDPLAGKRITVRLQWTNTHGPQEVQLVTWVHPPQERPE